MIAAKQPAKPIASPRTLQTKKAVKLGPRFLRAFDFAAEKHAGQARKASTIPYIAHLMGVASLVLEAGGDEDLAIAALLHDVVEDCGGAPMLKEVRRRFGKRVARIVNECTDADSYPKPPWRKRKEKYLRRLRKADAGARLVSAADKLNNVRSILSDYRAIGDSVWLRFNGGREGTLWYYRALLNEFLGHKLNRITRDFDLAVNELESLAAQAIADS
ncbi:MAG TPA: HD domain-containing protein [Candidatus Sulfotelmatobacter sp.]